MKSLLISIIKLSSFLHFIMFSYTCMQCMPLPKAFSVLKTIIQSPWSQKDVPVLAATILDGVAGKGTNDVDLSAHRRKFL